MCGFVVGVESRENSNSITELLSDYLIFFPDSDDNERVFFVFFWEGRGFVFSSLELGGI